MYDTPIPRDPFATLKPIIQAWGAATDAWMAQHPPTLPGAAPLDRKAQRMHARRFQNTETMMALGYVLKATREQPTVAQSMIARVLSKEGRGSSKAVSQDLGRRFEALEVFGLVALDRPQENVVLIRRTELTAAFYAEFTALYAAYDPIPQASDALPDPAPRSLSMPETTAKKPALTALRVLAALALVLSLGLPAASAWADNAKGAGELLRPGMVQAL